MPWGDSGVCTPLSNYREKTKTVEEKAYLYMFTVENSARIFTVDT